MMFKDELVKVRHSLFLAQVEERIDGLANIDFDVEEETQFRSQMRTAVKELVRLGEAAHEKTTTEASFLGTREVVTVKNGNDGWEVKLVARKRTLLVNAGRMRRMPWESLCFNFDTDGIPGVDQFNRMPAGTEDELSAGRDAALDYLGTELVTLKDMKNVVSTYEKEIMQNDRYFVLEKAFLFDG